MVKQSLLLPMIHLWGICWRGCIEKMGSRIHRRESINIRGKELFSVNNIKIYIDISDSFITILHHDIKFYLFNNPGSNVCCWFNKFQYIWHSSLNPEDFRYIPLWRMACNKFY